MTRTTKRLEAHAAWMQCRQAALAALFLPAGQGRPARVTTTDIHNPPVFSSQTAGMMKVDCRHLAAERGPNSDTFKEVLLSFSLRRWLHVFGREQLQCVRMKDSLTLV